MCDRLWVVDTGLADILGEPTVYSDPAILIYDLNTDKLVRKYTFKEDVVKQDSFFANIVSSNYLLLMIFMWQNNVFMQINSGSE